MAGSQPSTVHPTSRDIQTKFMWNSGSCSRHVGIGREDIIRPSNEDPRNLGLSEWDQQLGKMDYEFSLYDEMRWKWDNVYLLRGLPNKYSPSLCPPPWPLYLRTPAVASWRCAWRLWSSEFGDAPGGRDRASLEIHLEAVMEQEWRCTWSPWLCELRGCNCASLEIRLETAIKRVWRCTWRP